LLKFIKSLRRTPPVEQKSSMDAIHAQDAGVDIRRKNSQENAEIPRLQGITPKIGAHLYANSPDAFSSINFRASMLSTCPFKVKFKNKSGKYTEVTTGVSYNLLNYPSKIITRSQLIIWIESWLCIAGYCYVAIEQGEKPGTYEVVLMPPENVVEEADPDKKYRYFIYRYKGEEYYYPEERVMKFERFNPFQHYYGLSPMNAIKLDLENAKFTKQAYNTDAGFGNLGGAWISTERERDDEEVQKLKKEFRERTPESSRILILSSGFKYNELKDKVLERQSEILKVSEEAVGKVFGVPPGMSSASQDELPDFERFLWNNTLVPSGNYIAEVITHKFQDLFSTKTREILVEMDYSGVWVLEAFRMERMKRQATMVEMGLETPNEYREEEGKPLFTGELADYGNTPRPKWEADNAVSLQKLNPSGTAPGANGGESGRSPGGQRPKPDTSGKKDLD